MSFETEMRLNDTDVYRLIKACQVYQDKTGSEYMWDEYNESVSYTHLTLPTIYSV